MKLRTPKGWRDPWNPPLTPEQRARIAEVMHNDPVVGAHCFHAAMVNNLFSFMDTWPEHRRLAAKESPQWEWP